MLIEDRIREIEKFSTNSELNWFNDRSSSTKNSDSKSTNMGTIKYLNLTIRFYEKYLLKLLTK